VLNAAVIATVFGLIFVSELPDKTAVASVVLGTRYPARWVFTGVAAGFLTHVVIAVAAGSLLMLLPRRPVEAVVACLFILGAVLLWRHGSGEDEDETAVAAVPDSAGLVRVASLGFAIIFVAEWGDLTQILCANLTARYGNPISVGIGAVLGLWAVGLLAILGGRTLLRIMPMTLLVRIAAGVMVGLACYSLVRAAQ
jgi:putative Ca2+/H+ antiporter (TMEM165/GDT1 family)